MWGELLHGWKYSRLGRVGERDFCWVGIEVAVRSGAAAAAWAMPRAG